MRADKDVPRGRPETRDNVTAVIGEFLHPDIKAGLLELVKDVLCGFLGAGLSRAPALQGVGGQPRHMGPQPIDANGGERQKRNKEPRNESPQSTLLLSHRRSCSPALAKTLQWISAERRRTGRRSRLERKKDARADFNHIQRLILDAEYRVTPCIKPEPNRPCRPDLQAAAVVQKKLGSDVGWSVTPREHWSQAGRRIGFQNRSGHLNNEVGTQYDRFGVRIEEVGRVGESLLVPKEVRFSIS